MSCNYIIKWYIVILFTLESSFLVLGIHGTSMDHCQHFSVLTLTKLPENWSKEVQEKRLLGVFGELVVLTANEHDRIGSHSYEKVKSFKYLGSLLTNQNSIQEEIKCRLKAGNSCYYSVQTPLSSRLLSKNLEIIIYKRIILPVVPNGCEAWSFTLREECRLRVFENRILRRIFGP